MKGLIELSAVYSSPPALSTAGIIGELVRMFLKVIEVPHKKLASAVDNIMETKQMADLHITDAKCILASSEVKTEYQWRTTAILLEFLVINFLAEV